MYTDFAQRTPEQASEASLTQAAQLSKVIDVRNADARGIAAYNRKKCLELFSPDNLNNTGKTEVQIAILTLKIRQLWQHLSLMKRDTANKSAINPLIWRRRKTLRYMRTRDPEGYAALLPRIGMERGAAEGPLHI